MHRLTYKQRQFAQTVAAGATYTSAYQQVYSSRCKPATARSEASRLANLPKVAEEINRLQQPPVDPLQEAQKVTVQALLQEAQSASRSRDRRIAMRMLGQIVNLL